MGQVPTLGTLFRKKEMTIKRDKEKQEGDPSFPTGEGGQEKLLGSYRGPISFGKLGP